LVESIATTPEARRPSAAHSPNTWENNPAIASWWFPRNRAKVA
jgi:hypothetical protein